LRSMSSLNREPCPLPYRGRSTSNHSGAFPPVTSVVYGAPSFNDASRTIRNIRKVLDAKRHAQVVTGKSSEIPGDVRGWNDRPCGHLSLFNDKAFQPCEQHSRCCR
jgi:hypothetical protein